MFARWTPWIAFAKPSAYGNDFFRQRGLYHLTDTMDVLGATLDGGWAEYMVYPADALVHKVPDNVSDNAACYVEPFSSGRANRHKGLFSPLDV